MDGLSKRRMLADGIHWPSPGLADCVRSALVTRLPGGRYILPAALHPVLLVIVQGGIGVLRDGVEVQLPRLALCGGTRGPRDARAEAGTRIVTLSLLPGGLGALFGVPAGALMEEAVDLAEVADDAGRGLLAGFVDGLPPAAATQDLLSRLWGLLEALRRDAAGQAGLWVPPTLLSLPVAQLAEKFGLGQRQFERRFQEAYGQSLRSYRQQLRCSRLLQALGAAMSPVDGWAEMAVAAGYADQAHLCRDVRRFTGHSPAGLVAGVAGDDPAFWPYRIDPLMRARHFGPSGF
ncbi:helix-turn-helix domain-containing protein [Zoogloea sp.]|uniref:helix-turn-helix domain-containing protein n=1 Tax=Zoogloea sp. TaxID=49181 RepID=UPI0035AF638F